MDRKEKKRLYMREYNKRPEVQARQKRQWKEKHIENLKRLKEYRDRPQSKLNAHNRYIQKRRDPEWINARYKKHTIYRKTGDFKSIRKDIYLNQTYGISLDEYNALLIKQNNACAICLNEETSIHQSGVKRRLAVDHCHKTGIIRGLLCNKCNRALGYLYDNIVSAKNLVTYLENSLEMGGLNVDSKMDDFYISETENNKTGENNGDKKREGV